MRFGGLIIALLAGLNLIGLAQPAHANRQFEFLYINANEGSASGGHAAIKFDNQVFHFQHVEPGLLRLYRDDFAAFEFAYAFQENRSIYGHRIDVSDDFFQALRETFTRRLLIQNQQFSGLQTLYDDLSLASGLQNPDTAAPLALKGLGYFFSDYRLSQSLAETPQHISAPLTQLRQSLINRYGSDFLSGKQQKTWQTLQALKPTLGLAAEQLTENRFETWNLSFAQRYRNQLLNLAALDALQTALAPRAETLLQAPLAQFKLNPAQLAKLVEFQQRLFADLPQLLHSERDDWGFALLVGMARLHALEQSIATGYLVVLDRSNVSDDQPQIANVDLPAALQYTQQVFATTSQLNNPESLDERSYAELELSASALHYVNQQTQAFKLPRLSSTPSRPALAKLVDLPLRATELARHQTLVAAQIQSYQDKLQSLYAYQLVGRNCATEIFRLVNQTIASIAPHEDATQASQRLLGGYMDEQGLTMIPFVAYAQVAETYRVSASFEKLPYRDRQRQQHYLSAPTWQVDIQESNLLSSSIYQWNDADAAFLFFTQDQVWPRPLQGGFNLAAAGGQGIYGLFSWPWDDGHNLKQGLKGMLVSLPELMFFNIRKGSFPNLLPEPVTPK